MENRERIAALLFEMNKEFSTTIITATHDWEIANRYDRVIHLERSKLNGIFRRKQKRGRKLMKMY